MANTVHGNCFHRGLKHYPSGSVWSSTERRILGHLVFLFLLVLLIPVPLLADQDRGTERNLLVDEILEDQEILLQVLKRDHLSPAVEQALRSVPRHEFIPENQRKRAYENRPLPIGYGQTISQPLIVALMTDLLELKPGNRALELGTGSGYQAAVLAALDVEVYSIEIVPELGTRAREVVQRLGLDNVQLRIADGYHGWPENAPFDAIIVTAAGDHIPPPLVEQLKPGGRMVLPVGRRFFAQQLLRVTKLEDGTVRTESLLPVAFVPLTGDH